MSIVKSRAWLLAYFALTAMMLAAYGSGWTAEPYTRIPRIPDTLYCLSWIYILLRSIRDRTSGYPPLLIMYPLVWELWAAVLYIGPIKMSPFMQFNYWVWLIVSFAVLYLVSRYDRSEFTFGHPRFFWAKVIGEFMLTSLLYISYVNFAPDGLEGFFIVIGTALATIISIFFFFLLVTRPTLKGQSFVGNLLRIFAENGSLSYTLSLHQDSLYLKSLLVFTLALDALYLVTYIRKWRSQR